MACTIVPVVVRLLLGACRVGRSRFPWCLSSSRAAGCNFRPPLRASRRTDMGSWDRPSPDGRGSGPEASHDPSRSPQGLWQANDDGLQLEQRDVKPGCYERLDRVLVGLMDAARVLLPKAVPGQGHINDDAYAEVWGGQPLDHTHFVGFCRVRPTFIVAEVELSGG